MAGFSKNVSTRTLCRPVVERGGALFEKRLDKNGVFSLVEKSGVLFDNRL